MVLDALTCKCNVCGKALWLETGQSLFSARQLCQLSFVSQQSAYSYSVCCFCFLLGKNKELAGIMCDFLSGATNNHKHITGNSPWHPLFNGGFLFFYFNISLSELVLLSKLFSQLQHCSGKHTMLAMVVNYFYGFCCYCCKYTNKQMWLLSLATKTIPYTVAKWYCPFEKHFSTDNDCLKLLISVLVACVGTSPRKTSAHWRESQQQSLESHRLGHLLLLCPNLKFKWLQVRESKLLSPDATCHIPRAHLLH